MSKYPESFAKVLSKEDEYEIQILYTQIDRRQNAPVIFNTYHFGVDEKRKFSPGESVKLPIILLSFEKLNQLKLDKQTPVSIVNTLLDKHPAFVDTTSENGLASIAHYAKKSLLGNDPIAFNKLYDFVELDNYNAVLKQKGYSNTGIKYLLAEHSERLNSEVKNEIIFKNGQDTLYRKIGALSQKEYDVDRVNYSHNVVTSEISNVFSITDGHEVLKSIFFSESIPPRKQFNLAENDYKFMFQYMSQLPVETSFPTSYSEDMHDGTFKYLLFGGRNFRVPRHIRSFNNTGTSNGYLVDHAYIVDFEKGIDFLLSAVMYCKNDGNADQTISRYDAVGKPFMEKLGKAIFEYELTRKRKSRPDLSKFEVPYDK